MRLQGVHTALVTPFRDGAVDMDSFRALAERQVAADIDGLVPCGTTGETPTLEHGEWADLIRAAVEVSAGRVPVTAGCGTNSTASTVAHIREARALGADAALVVFPYYNKPNAEGLRAHIKACAAEGLPLVLYHIPGRTGQRLSLDLLAELAATPGVVGIKEATADIQLGQELLDRTDVSILSGDDFTFAALMAMGGHGVISVVSNVAPRDTLRWARAAASGDVATLRALRTRLLPLVSWLFHSSNPVPVKAALADMGLCTNEVRLPLAPGAGPPAALLEGLA